MYLQTTDFKYGLDRRRQRIAGVPGTLWTIENAHISRGGDIERAKKFVAKYALPSGTYGMAQNQGQLFVFGSDAPPTMPLGVQYQQLAAPSTPSMTEVLDARSFDGKLYVIARYDDGNVYHYYNGSRVTDWDTLSDTAATAGLTASYLADLISGDSAVFANAVGNVITITSRTAGVDFTVSASVTDNGVDNTQTFTLSTAQANVSAVAETRATGALVVLSGTPDAGVNYISSVSISGQQLLNKSVNFINDTVATATAVAQEINNYSATSGYTASAIGATVTITASPGTGASPNGSSILVSAAGNISYSASTMAGGVTAVTAVSKVVTATIGGTFESKDAFSVTVNGNVYKATGRAAATGTYAFIHKRRIYSPTGSALYYCKLTDPSNWTDTTLSSGAGFINMSQESEGTERLVSCAPYGTNVAIFSEQSIRLYAMDTDATKAALVQPLQNTGTLAPRSVAPYGNNEVFYLDNTGIRSLRARDALNVVSVNDIGTATDTYVRTVLDSLPQGVVARAVGVLEPIDGRYWMAVGPNVFSLSYFPSSKITAWSVYKPGFTISDFVRVKWFFFGRRGHTIYLYGGDSGNEYPSANEQVVTIETPFVDASKPGTHKHIFGFDAAFTNLWEVTAYPDPGDETKIINIGRVAGPTYTGMDIAHPSIGGQSHIAYKYVCRSAGHAAISSSATHFENVDAG